MNENSDFWLQLILGTIVLIPPIWTIWKNYYDKFKVAVISNNIYLDIHEWDANRFEIRFFIPMRVVNISNSMGIVTNMRLKLKYQIKGVLSYSEYVIGEFELISENDKKFDHSARGDSLYKIVKSEVISFPLKPQQQCKKHILFRTFWKDLRIVNHFQVILEMQLDNKRWEKCGKWAGHLWQNDYNYFISKGSPILLVKESKSNRIIQKWRQHMSKKIAKKYGTNVEMHKIELPPSESKW